MQIIVTIEVPEWVKERLSVEDNTAAWDWVNTRTACVTAESVFGNWPGVGWISEYERAMSKAEAETESSEYNFIRPSGAYTPEWC